MVYRTGTLLVAGGLTRLRGNAIGLLSHSSILDQWPLTHTYTQADCYLLLSVRPHTSHNSL